MITQERVDFYRPATTLRTSYETLIDRAWGLFGVEWPKIRQGVARDPYPIGGKGSYHRSAGKAPWWSNLPLGLDTPVKQIEEMGAEHYASVAGMDKLGRDITAAL